MSTKSEIRQRKIYEDDMAEQRRLRFQEIPGSPSPIGGISMYNNSALQEYARLVDTSTIQEEIRQEME